MLRWLFCCLLAGAVAAKQPPPQLMYLSPEEELKLAVALKRQSYAWPVMRVGIGKSGPRWFGHIRFWVGPGAGRSEVLRQSRQAALLAFRMFPALHQIDLDACPEDDTKLAKARPWFAASLLRERTLKASLDLPPLAWFEDLCPLTLRAELHGEGDAALHFSQQILKEWSR